MSTFSIRVFFVLCLTMISSVSEAKTRAPKTENEFSVLYWRYLCENQSQIEHNNELSCPGQNWKIKILDDQVSEVIEDAKK